MPKEAQSSSQGSILALSLTGCLSVMAAIVLVFLTVGIAGNLIGIVAALFAFVAMHYLLWGRWLSDSIRAEVEAEQSTSAGDKPHDS